MTNAIHIGLVGDYSPDVKAHFAIPQAVALASSALAYSAEVSWLETKACEHITDETLATYDALWCVPGSPYESMDGALRAIRFAREQGVPFLGTCGGFQHALIEYARNALGLAEANHAESNPDGVMLLMTPLVCSLVEKDGTVTFRPGSRIAAIYGRSATVEQYHCSFGLNPKYQPLLEQSGIQITGWDVTGEARVFELPGHPFYMGTLFQPERSALSGTTHPLIKAFLQAANEVKKSGTKKEPSPRINKIRSPARWV